MAYNTNTRLLIKFGEAAGATVVADTSAQAKTATFSAGAVTAAQGVFSTRSAPVGNPGGTYSNSSVALNSPNGVFLPGIMPRQFDVWFRMYGYPITQGNQPLIYIKFANNDTLTLNAGPTDISAHFNGTRTASASASYYQTPNVWRHFRLLVDGKTMRVGAGGAELCSTTIDQDIWTGSDTNLPIEIRFGSSFDGTSGAQGFIDAIEFTEGSVTWSGGAYTVPSSEPENAPLMSEIFGEGANTLESCDSVGTVGVYSIAECVGANTLDDVGNDWIVLLERYGVGSTTVDDVASEGYANTGPIIGAVGANTTEAVISTGSGVLTPISIGTGSATIDSVASTGYGGIDWRVAEGSNTLDNVTQAGTGSVANAAEITGNGENVVAVASSGSGVVDISGQGYNTVYVSSSGTIKDEQFAQGSCVVAVESAGTAIVETFGRGFSLLEDCTSSGALIVSVFGSGVSVASVTSRGSGRVDISGVGSNTTGVFTSEDFVDDVDHVSAKTVPAQMFLRIPSASISVMTR